VDPCINQLINELYIILHTNQPSNH
jgi:hypothetical protein